MANFVDDLSNFDRFDKLVLLTFSPNSNWCCSLLKKKIIIENCADKLRRKILFRSGNTDVATKCSFVLLQFDKLALIHHRILNSPRMSIFSMIGSNSSIVIPIIYNFCSLAEVVALWACVYLFFYFDGLKDLSSKVKGVKYLHMID